MASYGKIYEFVRDSQNGAEIIITISKKNYNGESMVRPLGRAPMLKRENNGHIFGTSLEIYAECKVDGEFAQFYTSSADEFLVEVWKDQVLIWSGFISPELYSEPDIAPPYDVQIIATDGLGELRNFEFVNDGDVSISDHLSQLISHTGLSLETVMASDLRYYGGEVASDAVDILDFRVDLSHEDGESCYDVLQNLLSSLNASITQFNGKWFIFRETDFIGLASADGLKAFAPGGSETFMDIATFGSAKTCQWWPVGQLSSVIEPAKNRLTLISPNNYKNNVLDGSWTSVNGAVYDEAEAAYVLPDEGSYITQKVDFEGDYVEYRLALRVTARNVGSGEEDQDLGIRIMIDGKSPAGVGQYWLVQSASSDRNIGAYLWRKNEEGEIEAELAVPSDSDTAADAQDVDIILPLYRTDDRNRSYVGATSVEVTIFNPAGIHDIYVYGVSLSKYDQFEGYQANVVLDNGAREEGSSIDLSLSDGATAPAAGNVFMSGIPLQPDADEAIVSWGIGLSDAEDYIGLMAKDYSRQVALPRMSYKGILNVPRAAIPALFLRDNTYYFPRTYTYDLYNDELEVDLISIPAADLSIESIQVGQIAQSQGVPSSGGSGGGGGIGGGVDLSGYAKKEEVTTLFELLASMWSIDKQGNLVTEKQVIIKSNLIVAGDTSSEGTGESVVSGITGIKLNGTTYKDENNDGIIDLGTITGGLTSVSWSDVQGRPTKVSEFLNDSGFITSAALVGYATQSWVEGKGYITGIDKSMVASAVGSSGNAGKVLSSTGGDLGWVSLPTSLPASDVYAWAKKSSLALADVPDLSSKYLSVNGGTINGTTTDPIIVNTSETSVGVRLQINKVHKAYVGYGSSVGAYLYNYDTGAYIGVDTSGSPFYHNGTIKNTIIHSGNIGSQFVEGLGTAYANQDINLGREGKVRMIYGTASNSASLGYPRQYTSGLSVLTAYSGWQMVTYGSSLLPNPYFRKLVDDGTWFDWKQLAFLDDNVASAQALTHSNGTVGAVVNSSGNVGIGTTSPLSKLSVHSNAMAVLPSLGALATEYTIEFGHAGKYGTYLGTLGSGIGFIQQGRSDGTATAYNLLLQPRGGNVGIGTDNPAYKLDVNGTGRFTGAVTMSSTLNVSGNVGIGVTSPSTPLHVNYSNTSNPMSGAIGVHINRQGVDSNSAAGAALALTTGSKGAVIYGGNLGIVLSYYDGSSFTSNFRIKPSGNVCIGKDIEQQTAGRAQLSLVSTTDVPTDLILGPNALRWTITARNSSDQYPYSLAIYDYVASAYRMRITSAGEVHVYKNLVVSGDTATGSDIRFKDKITDHRIALESIANAPLFTFKWNDREDKTEHLGTSAQYWEGVAPWLVKGTDFKVLDYSTLGVAIGISLAKKALNHEERIKILEKENEQLKEQLRRINYGN